MTWRFIDNSVLLKEVKPPTTTAGGIALPDQAKRQEPIGCIIALGDQVDDSILQVGMRVLIRSFGGFPLAMGGEEFIVVRGPHKTRLEEDCDIVAVEVTDGSPESNNPS